MKIFFLLCFIVLSNFLYAVTQTPFDGALLHEIEDAINTEHQEKALCYLKKEVERYNLEALYVMGVLYLNGCYNGGIRNPREATIYFAKAAAKGYVPAISALADSFLNGDGAQESQSYAFELYKKAADLGYGIAQFHVAVLYRDGIGVKKSLSKARKYFKMAFENKYFKDLQDEARKLHDELLR